MFIAYFDISLKKLKNDLLLLCHYGIVSLFHPLRIICIIRPFFFLNPDGTRNETTNVAYVTKLLSDKGLRSDGTLQKVGDATKEQLLSSHRMSL